MQKLTLKIVLNRNIWAHLLQSTTDARSLPVSVSSLTLKFSQKCQRVHEWIKCTDFMNLPKPARERERRYSFPDIIFPDIRKTIKPLSPSADRWDYISLFTSAARTPSPFHLQPLVLLFHLLVCEFWCLKPARRLTTLDTETQTTQNLNEIQRLRRVNSKIL